MFGGGERYPLELARALAAHVECELITFGRVPSRRRIGELEVRTLRAIGFLRGHPAHPFAPGLARALAGADLIHTHHMRSAPSRMAAALAALSRQRAVVTDHGLGGGDWAGVLPKLFDRFLTVSEYSARQLNAPESKTRVIYGGADPTLYCPGPVTERRGVLFVGRLTPHKGVDRLIAAVPPGVPLTIAGSTGHDPDPPESGYGELLQQLARDRGDVSFVESVSDDVLASLYRESEVLALPSVHTTCYGKKIEVSELLGLVALEAMASGTPIVASRIGGLSEVVLHGETGFLVEPGNVEDLRHHLSVVLGDAGLARRLGENARALVLEKFTWEACAARCLTAYDELASGDG